MEISSSPNVKMKRFVFTSTSESHEMLTVNIPECVDPHYSMYTWPSAVVVGQYVWFHKNRFQGKAVVELGAGTALCGIVAALCGANVTLADNLMIAKCVENAKRSCEANNLYLKVVAVKWAHFNEALMSLTNLDYLILSDCFYDPNDFEDIVVTISFLLSRNPGCRCIIGYQIRCASWSISDLLAKWKLTAEKVSLESFEADDSCIAGSNLPGSHTIQLLEITAAAALYS
ncbi:Methyltransferase-like protein 23 [Chamberlinius hualienensis]